MLKNNNNIMLTKYNYVDSKYVFFIQRWNEILESKTLDMYQYNILNSCVACDEFADVIDKTLNGILTSRQNIDDCKAETVQILKSDLVLEKHNTPLRNTLLRILNSKIESKQRSDSIDDKSTGFYTSLNRIKYKLINPLKTIKREYLNYVLSELKDSIESENQKMINDCIGILVSQCIYQGWSAKGLADLSKIFQQDCTSEEKWINFNNKISLTNHENYEIYYSIKIETKVGLNADTVRNVIASLGLEVECGTDIISSHDDNAGFCSKINSDTTYIKTNISATDQYSAVLKAINILNSKLSIATFYNTISPWIANYPQIIFLNCTTGQHDSLRLTDIFKTYDYVDTNNNVFEDTRDIITAGLLDDTKNKLDAVFAYTNLSRSSIFQETKYITLWIALESVMRTGQYPDIITHIKCVLPEILATRYVYRIVRNFIEDCTRCKLSKCIELDLNFEQEDKKRLVKNIITVFRDSSNYEILLSKCNRNQLLKYRCEEIHELLNNNELLAGRLEHYTQKIRWHIQRLYRIRNEITHSAFNENKSLVIYIEHLYTYLSQLISEIVYYIAHKDSKSIDEAYATILENYITYVELIKDGYFETNSLLPNGIIEFE